jgi:hypothetical protein
MPAYATRPFTYSYAFITVTVTNYGVIDSQHAIVHGSIRNDGWLTVRLLSAYGTATTLTGVQLGSGYMIDLLADIAPQASIEGQADLQSYYTLTQLKQMNVKAIHVHAVGIYCLPTWLGCLGPFTHTYDRTFTSDELITLAKSQGVL